MYDLPKTCAARCKLHNFNPQKTGVIAFLRNMPISVFYPAVILSAVFLWLLLYLCVWQAEHLQNAIRSNKELRYAAIMIAQELKPQAANLSMANNGALNPLNPLPPPSLLQSSPYFTPAMNYSNPAGIVSSYLTQVNANLDTLQTKLDTIFATLQIIIIFALVICLYAYVFAKYNVLRPLLVLTRQAKQIAEGNYGIRNQININNEVGILGKAMNRMCDTMNDDISSQKRMQNEIRLSEESFRGIMENAPIGMATVSPEGRYLQVNRAQCEITGYSKPELLNLTFRDITYPDDLDESNHYLYKLISGKIKTFQMEKRYIRKDGRIIWVLLNVSILYGIADKSVNFISQIQDITERKENEKRLTDLNENMSIALNELKQHQDELVLINKTNDMLQTCKELKEAYTIIALTSRELFPALSGGLAIYNESSKTLETVEKWGNNPVMKLVFSPDDCWAIRGGHVHVVTQPSKDISCNHFTSQLTGEYIDLPLVVQSEMIGMFHLSAPPGYVISPDQQQLAVTFSEVIKLSLANIELREALHDQSIRDPLTGLFNRRYLNETLPRELQLVTREKRQLCVAMLDLDYFKRFNDDYGHEAGDEVLKHIGNLLKHKFRGSDIACRFGGEEFVVVLLDGEIQTVIQRLQQIRDDVKHASLTYHNKVLPSITLSIGVAKAPEHGGIGADLIRAADVALYAAKQGGRDRLEIFHDKMISRVHKSS